MIFEEEIPPQMIFSNQCQSWLRSKLILKRLLIMIKFPSGFFTIRILSYLIIFLMSGFKALGWMGNLSKVPFLHVVYSGLSSCSFSCIQSGIEIKFCRGKFNFIQIKDKQSSFVWLDFPSKYDLARQSKLLFCLSGFFEKSPCSWKC